MNLRDRLKQSDSVTKALIPIVDGLIAAVNAMIGVVIYGGNAHKTNDTVDTVTVGDTSNLDEVGDLEKNLDESYVAHIASTDYHLAADVTNTLTAKSVYAKVKLLADDMKTQYAAHRILVSTKHAVEDAVNVVTAAVVSSKATAITLLNDIKAKFNLHCADAESHGKTVVKAAIVLLGDELTTDYEAHRVLVSTTHAVADSTNALVGTAITTKASAITILNDIKAKFNLHCAEAEAHGKTVVKATLKTLTDEMAADYEAHRVLVSTQHAVGDTTNAIAAATMSTKATAITLVNDMKTKYNLHCADAEAHGKTTAKAALKVLADELKADYNVHRVLISTQHADADSVNEVTAADMTTKASAVTLVNDLHAKYNLHCAEAEAHGKTVVKAAIKALTDEITTDYEAHRVLVGTQHAVADSTNALVGTAVSTKASAITILNDIKTKFNLHLLEAEAHGKTVVKASIKALTDDIYDMYEAHRVLIAGGEHGAADVTNNLAAVKMTTKASAITLLNDIKAKFNAHIVLVAAATHVGADVTNTVVLGDLGVGATWTQIAAMADSIRAKYEGHRQLAAATGHAFADATNDMTVAAVGVVTDSVDATNTVILGDLGVAATWAEIAAMADSIKLKYNAHRVFVTLDVHGAADATNDTTTASVGAVVDSVDGTNLVSGAVLDGSSTWAQIAARADDVKAKYNAHIAFVTLDVHGAVDAANATTAASLGALTDSVDTTNTVVLSDLGVAATWAQIAALADSIKAKYNAHIAFTTLEVHGAADITNGTVAASVGAVTDSVDATNLVTTTTLAPTATWAQIAAMADAIKAKYNAHRVFTTLAVHGAADATNDTTTADVGAVADSVDAVNLVTTTTLTSSATWAEIQAMADAIRTKYEAHRVYTTGVVHGAADATNIATVAAVGSTQTSVNAYLTELKADLNAHMILATSHSMKDTSNEITMADATTLGTSWRLANELKSKFNTHISLGESTTYDIDLIDDIKV